MSGASAAAAAASAPAAPPFGWPGYVYADEIADRPSYFDFLFEVLGADPIPSSTGTGAPPVPAAAVESIASRIGSRQRAMIQRREEANAALAAMSAAWVASGAASEAGREPATQPRPPQGRKKGPKRAIDSNANRSRVEEKVATMRAQDISAKVKAKREKEIRDSRINRGNLRQDVSLETYFLAGEGLIPFLLLSRKQLTPSTVTVDVAGATSKRLKSVCIPVYGEFMSNELASNWTPRGKSEQIRYFFEIDGAPKQCAKVFTLYPEGHPVFIYCWECGYKITKFNQCEHVFPILFALMITGLYDTILHAAMERQGLGRQYLELLKYEYRSAHDRCNQLKSDDVYIKYLPGPRRAGNAMATFGVDYANITTTLGKISSAGYPNYEFKYEDLAENWRADAKQWKGITDKLDDGVATVGEWTRQRQAAMASVVQAALDKFGFGQGSTVTVKDVSAHFVNGLLNRAIYLEPVLTREHLWDKLNPEQQGRLTAWLKKLRLAGGTRHHTRRVRRSLRHARLRGGSPDGLDVVEMLIDSIVKHVYLVRLYTEVTKAIEAIRTDDAKTFLSTWNKSIGAVYDRHVRVVNGLVDSILATEFEIPSPENGDAKDAIEAILYQTVHFITNSGPLDYPWSIDALPSTSVFVEEEPELPSRSLFVEEEPELPSRSLFVGPPTEAAAAAANAGTQAEQRPAAPEAAANAERPVPRTPLGVNTQGKFKLGLSPSASVSSPRGISGTAQATPLAARGVDPNNVSAANAGRFGLRPSATGDPVNRVLPPGQMSGTTVSAAASSVANGSPAAAATGAEPSGVASRDEGALPIRSLSGRPVVEAAAVPAEEISQGRASATPRAATASLDNSFVSVAPGEPSAAKPEGALPAPAPKRQGGAFGPKPNWF